MYHIQHADKNRGPADYSGLKPDVLLVTDIFYTVQGEGPFAGHPAIFIRLAGCNRGAKQGMGCEFCDTFFSFDQGNLLTFENICARMMALIDMTLPRPLVVITGGEPMLQNSIVPFIELLYWRGWKEIQIESNGDRLAKNFFGNDICHITTLVVSPKVTKLGYRPLNENVFLQMNVLKFVVDARPDSPYHGLPDYIQEWKGRTYVSPLTIYKKNHDPGKPVSMWDPDLIDHELTMANYRWAAKLAMNYGLIVSIQQHLFYQVP